MPHPATAAAFKTAMESLKPTKTIEISKDGLLSVKILKQYLNPFDNNINSYDSGIVLFSSGTSGKPKMMLQNLSELIRNIKVPRRQKKLSFIRLFLLKSKIWLLDEPYSGMDAINRNMISKMIEKNINNNGIVLMSTHESRRILNVKSKKEIEIV